MRYGTAKTIIKDTASYTHTEVREAILAVLSARVAAPLDTKLARKLYEEFY
jgi:hypothetical protein